MYETKNNETSRKVVWNADRTEKITRVYPGAKVTRNYHCRAGLGCKMLIPVALADAMIPALLRSHDGTITREVTVAGRNFDNDIDQIGLYIQALNPVTTPEYRQQVDAKLAEIERLRSLPAIPSYTTTVEIDMVSLL